MSKWVGSGYFDKREFRTYNEFDDEGEFETVNQFETIFEIDSLTVSTLKDFVNNNDDFREYVLDSIRDTLDEDEEEIFDENIFILADEDEVAGLFFNYYEQDDVFSGRIFDSKEESENWVSEMTKIVKKLEQDFEFECHKQGASGEFSEVWRKK